MTFGVGIIGAGPGASALHGPTLSYLEGLFRVVHVSDAGSGRASEIARRTHARSSSGIDELLADPAVEVVVLSSPPPEHAAQILAAVAAGKRGILAEKPLATTLPDAESVIVACRAAGVALVVGTNHFFDPAWERAKHHLIGNGERVEAITIEVALPPNTRLHSLVTELEHPAVTPAGRGVPDWSNTEISAAVVRQLVLGLAVHDLPLLRDLAPDIDRVLYARPVSPIGLAVGYLAGGVVVQISAVMTSGGADPLWRMRITTTADRVEIEFPPAFVHGGSATATVRGADGRYTRYPREQADGYLREWEELADLLHGRHVVEYDELLADARYAITLADEAARIVQGGVS